MQNPKIICFDNNILWRLPTRAECKQLFSSGEHRLCHYFNDLKYPSWTVDACPKKKDSAAFAYFASGSTSTEKKKEKFCVRLVRDLSDDELMAIFADYKGRFALTPCQGAVADRLTGIAWSRRVQRPRCSWFEIESAVKNFNNYDADTKCHLNENPN